MEGVIAGYGELTDDMTFRTAVDVEVHLMIWCNRRETIVVGLTVSRGTLSSSGGRKICCF